MSVLSQNTELICKSQNVAASRDEWGFIIHQANHKGIKILLTQDTPTKCVGSVRYMVYMVGYLMFPSQKSEVLC